MCLFTPAISLRLVTSDGGSSLEFDEDAGTVEGSVRVEVVSGSAEIDIDLTDSILLTSTLGAFAG